MSIKLFARLALLPFGLLTAYAIYEVGVLGVFAHQLQHWGGVQVLVDLILSVLMLLFWLIPDARRKGRNPWPYVLLSLAAGSFGPLLYFAFGADQNETAKTEE